MNPTVKQTNLLKELLEKSKTNSVYGDAKLLNITSSQLGRINKFKSAISPSMEQKLYKT
jgi:hypothetical protein